MVKRKETQNIVLIGFMATGKTTIAKELAKSLDRNFIDTDRLIEEKVGISIPEIFQKHGETYFRGIEKEIINQVSRLENIIISCGGGVVLDPENIKRLRKKGKILLLEADPQTIIDRIEGNKSRPLLNGKNNIESIKKIMDERKDLYLQAADIVIDTRGKVVSMLREEILELLKK